MFVNQIGKFITSFSSQNLALELLRTICEVIEEPVVAGCDSETDASPSDNPGLCTIVFMLIAKISEVSGFPLEGLKEPFHFD